MCKNGTQIDCNSYSLCDYKLTLDLFVFLNEKKTRIVKSVDILPLLFQLRPINQDNLLKILKNFMLSVT